MLPWVLCGILAISVLALAAKVRLMQKSMDEIRADLGEHLSQDTNHLISISSGDRCVRRLASELNIQLRLLRQQRRRYLSGDRELKEAVTNISHDLRTPLTAICGYLDLLEQEEKSEDAARYLSYIENRVQAMKRLTEELFRYSVILSTEDMTLEAVDLNATLEESMAAFYASMTKRGITPTVQMPEKRVIRQLDPGALSRILENILSNALKYSGGDLNVTLMDSGELIFTNTAAELDEVQVGRLFDRFFSVDSGRNSTGLGLAISKALVERMGGSICAGYKEGKLSVYLKFEE